MSPFLAIMVTDIETSFQAAINAGQINGAVICATNTNGQFVYNEAFGQRTLPSGDKRPQQLDDVLYLASATKLITTIAALQCVEDGLLTLDGDLSAVAPELANKKVLTGFAEDGKTPILEPATRRITLEMLLSHSSGLVYHFVNPTIAKWREKFSTPNDTSRRPVEELFNYPLAFQPGEGWMYGPGLDWAGRIVERVTGLTLGERIQQRIFDPLDITDGQFCPVTREDLLARMVDLNPDDPEGLGRAVLGGDGAMNRSTRGDFGGQGLFLPGKDYIKILHSLLVNNGKLLRPATADDMFEHHLSPKATGSHQAALTSPMGVFFLIGLEPSMKTGHGLGGLLLREDVDGWFGDHTLSWGGGLTLTWFIDRKNDLCGIVAVQASLPVNVEAVAQLKQVFRRDIYCKRSAWREEQ